MTAAQGMLRFIALSGLLAVSACSSRMPLVERLDANELYAHATERLEARRWDAAVEAFERFVFRFPGDPRQQEARYQLGQAYLGKREFLTAAVEFTRFASDFPNSPFADDARFGACEAYYRLSPPAPLDQQYTEAAIDHCASMAQYYPESEFAPRARERVVELTNRLALKQFNVAEHYLRRRAFDSAIMAYNDVIAFFPGTESAPRALLRTVEIFARLGYDSEEQAARQRLLRDYPASAEARQLQQQAARGGP
jgi:outer membrane protein assembly factor BamD